VNPSNVLLLGGVMLAAAAANAAPAHVHGVATLDVVLEGPALQLDFDSPLDNLVGFEHAPQSPQQVQAVRAMAQRFAAPLALFVPSPAARCAVQSIHLSSPVIDPTLLSIGGPGATAAGAGAHADDDGHAELHAEIALRCGQPQHLKRLEARIFGTFPRMGRIDAQVAAPRGQSAAKLTAASPAIEF
jgi:hypothetical protein